MNYVDIHNHVTAYTTTVGFCYCGKVLRSEKRTFYETLFKIPFTDLRVVKRYIGTDFYCVKHGSFNEVNIELLK